jgi:hypothetical protein
MDPLFKEVAFSLYKRGQDIDVAFRKEVYAT